METEAWFTVGQDDLVVSGGHPVEVAREQLSTHVTTPLGGYRKEL